MNRDMNYDLSVATEDGLVDYLRAVCENGDRPFVLNDKLGWVKTFPTAWPNYIFYANFGVEEMDVQVSEIIVKIKKGELPDQWVVGPKSRPTNLCEYLEKNGFIEEYDMAGMAIDLTKINMEVSIPEGVNILEVHSESMLQIWADVVSNGLWDGGTFESCLFEKLLDDPSFKLYLAFLDGEPVATSMLQLSNNVACINLVSTLSQFGRRGIGTAMTKTPLNYAREVGYKTGILQASQAGEHGYRKIGFEEYCKFHVYKYMK